MEGFGSYQVMILAVDVGDKGDRGQRKVLVLVGGEESWWLCLWLEREGIGLPGGEDSCHGHTHEVREADTLSQS